MLGASPHSDLLAHLFGFLAGVAVGLLDSMALGKPVRRSTAVQIACAAGTVLIVVASWFLALHFPGAPQL